MDPLEAFEAAPSTLDVAVKRGFIQPETRANLLAAQDELRADMARPDLAVEAMARRVAVFNHVVREINNGPDTKSRCAKVIAETTPHLVPVGEALLVRGFDRTPFAKVYGRGTLFVTLVIMNGLEFSLHEPGNEGISFHEVAHGEEAVMDASQSYNPDMAMASELLADAGGLTLGGGALADSLVRLMAWAKSDPTSIHGNHPAFGTRGTLLVGLAAQSWPPAHDLYASEVTGLLAPLGDKPAARDAHALRKANGILGAGGHRLRKNALNSQAVYAHRAGTSSASPRVSLAAEAPQ